MEVRGDIMVGDMKEPELSCCREEEFSVWFTQRDDRWRHSFLFGAPDG